MKTKAIAKYDGYIAMAFLLFIPLAVPIGGWIAGLFWKYTQYGSLIAAITCVAFSIGFAFSAFRQPSIGGKISASVALLILIAFYLFVPTVSS